ncbi:tRNA lysidine(34) synthetase TilS [Staphylococcus cohnii]|uniref:tRNA lysidine(34) synthetase TilS n=1 Tax=Staphylococcus cohnii TaxID=29382 RepID=UPI003D7DDE12
MVEVNADGWNKDQHIVLAVSTGIDSMVLLHNLINQLSQSYRKLTCLHVNHNIRDIAQEEESFIRKYCESYQIPLFVHHLGLSKVIEQGNSIENIARNERYQWFDDMMVELDADVLLTAHHQDDQIETIFYRLMTGRSTRSSLGMSYLTSRDAYMLCKPLLETTKADIRNYQQNYEVPYYEDETNAENHYVRNDIRNRILPAIDSNLHLSTKQLLKLKDWHDMQLQALHDNALHFIETHVHENADKTEIVIPRVAFSNLNHNIKIIILDKIFSKLQVTTPMTEKMYESWFQQLEGKVTQCTIYTTDKWNIYIAYDKFIIMANYDKCLVPTKILQPGLYHYGHYSIDITDNFPKDDYPLVVRTRNNGDKFKLNGVKGHKKVSRLLIDRKIIQTERNQLPILVNADETIIAIGTLYLNNEYKDTIFIRNTGEE